MEINAECLVNSKDLPNDVYRKLVKILTQNNAWTTIAHHLIMLGILTDDDLVTLSACQAPAEGLIHELGCRLCDVGTLCDILEQCQLHSALLLFKQPEPAVITEHPQGSGDENSKMVTHGGVLNLNCLAKGLPPPSYQWFRDSDPLQGCIQSNLSVQNFDFTNEGDYYCMVKQDGFDSLISRVIRVRLAPEHPVIEQQSRRQWVCRMGVSIVLAVKARGHPRITYQWFKGTRQLTGCTQPDLPINNIGVEDEGVYRCYIENEAGEVWSSPCEVTVFTTPEDISDDSDRPIASAKVALLIANQHYQNMTNLNTPIEDVRTLAVILRQHQFQVLALQNLTLVEMRNSVKELCKILPRHAYVVFYYAGHGFEMKEKYMLPVSAPGPDTYLKNDAFSEGELLKHVLDTHPQVFLELLDMCLKSPDPENSGIFQEVTELQPYAANNNLIQGYSTTSYLGAYERKSEKNGLYVKFLKQYFPLDISMVTILARVARDMEKECVKQMPYRGTNVTKEYRLTDSCEPCEHVISKIQALCQLPDIQLVRLPHTGVESLVTCEPYHGVFCNALHVIFTNLQRYHVTCQIEPELNIYIERIGKEVIVTVWNIQRIRTSQNLCLRLESLVDGHIDLAQFILGKPMIAVANLWLTLIQNILETRAQSKCIQHICPGPHKAPQIL